MSKNISELSGRKGLDKNLFEELSRAAEENGTPDAEALERIRNEFLVGKSTVFGTVSFYDFLKPENQGKKVYVCNGSACLCAGTQADLKNQLLQYFEEKEIGEMCCLGRCHENAAFWYNGRNYSGQDFKQLEDIKKLKINGNEQYYVGHSGTPILTKNYGDPSNYFQILQKALSSDVEQLLEELKSSGLRGRGGAGFPTAFKLDACRKEAASQRFIVCNADEGDPGAYSDRYIMEQRPYSLLMGMIIAGYIAGASRAVVYIRGEYPESVETVNLAIEWLREHNFLGINILGSGFEFDIKVIKAQGAYICGEETALLSSIEGQRPEVRIRPPFPTQKGLFNKPTVVNNVETLANLPFIVENGGKAYAAIGTEKSSGTKLISLDSHFKRPGIYEVDMGTPLAFVVDKLGQGFKTKVKALHIGGPLGGLVPLQKINDLNVDFDSFSKAGFLLGHASVVCIPEDFPIIKYIEHLFQFTAHESCGKCFPCRLGSTRGAELLETAIGGDFKIDRELFDDLITTMEMGSLCALGGGLPLPIRNALKYFEHELKQYFQ